MGDSRKSAAPLANVGLHRAAKNIAGRKFGRVTAISPTNKRASGTVIWKCRCECGRSFECQGRHLRSGATKSCGMGECHSKYKGENRYVRRGGQAVHRTIMEKVIGRPLHPDETVHHKNGNRRDNRPENLELWSTRHPKGQRVEDLVEWAEEIIRRYKS